MKQISEFLKLNLTDVAKGGVMAVLASFADAIYQVFHSCMTLACVVGFDWNAVWQAAVLAGGAYIVKNLFSDEEGKFLGRIG